VIINIDDALGKLFTGALPLLGVWLGSHLASGRTRRDKALDRQLAWLEEIAPLLNSLTIKSAMLLDRARRGVELNESQKVVADFFDHVERFQQSIGPLARLYGTKEAVTAVVRLSNALDEAAKGLPDGPIEPTGWVALFESVTNEAYQASKAIASEVRSLLAIGTVRPSRFRRAWSWIRKRLTFGTNLGQGESAK